MIEEVGKAQVLVGIMWAILAAVGTALLGLLVWGVKILIGAVYENTVAIRMLKEKMEDILKQYERIGKIEKDVNEAHFRIRVLSKREGDM